MSGRWRKPSDSTPEQIIVGAFGAEDLCLPGARSRFEWRGITTEEMDAGVPIPIVEEDFERWQPDDPESVGLCVDFHARWGAGVGADRFLAYVVTESLRQEWRTNREAQSRTLYCWQFHWPDVKNKLLGLVGECQRATQAESWEQLRKRFEWEYESTKPVEVDW